MHLSTLAWFIATSTLWPVGSQAQEDPADPVLEHWIWTSAEPGDGEEALFRRRFDLTDRPASAILSATADNRLECSIAGELLFDHAEWTYAVELDIAEHLNAGANELQFWCRNGGGPGALRAALDLTFEDGRQRRIVTDAAWEAAPSSQADPTWSAVYDFGPLGVEPWGQPQATRPADAGGTAPVETIEVPDGFEVELAYAVPRRQGSWVSLTFDDSGRAIASDQSGALYRLDPSQANARAERLEVDLGSAQGLTFAFGALYVVVNSFGDWKSGLYRLRDTTGDDQFDELTCLREFEGRGEHGPHAVVPGPDGASLWVLAGNHTALPEPFDKSRVARVWDEDQLLPREPDPNGHAVDVLAPGGWVARTDPDGESWELWAIGMRNAYDLAFDSLGEPFTFDSDMEWDVGLPWYRAARVLHLASGADFGWRHGSGKWPTHVPDSLPGVLDVGLASPTGVLRSSELAFPSAWSSKLFVADWAYGAIYAVGLEPDGGSYEATLEPFIAARGLPVTDLAVGPAGRFWFAVGGRGTRSALYAVRWTGKLDLTQEEASFADAAVLTRRRMEALHGTHVGSIERIWWELGHRDRFVRHAARVALESVDPERWSQRALSEERPIAAANALLALVRMDPSRAADVQARALELIAADGPALEFLRVLELASIRGQLALSADSVAPLQALFPTGDDALDRELAKLLVFAEALDAEALLARIDDARTQEEALAFAWLLRLVEEGWSDDLWRGYAEFVQRADREFEGGHSLSRYLAVMSERVEAEAPSAALDALADARIAEASFDADSGTALQFLSARSFQNAWRTSDLDGHLPALRAGRSFERGARVFAEASCLDCHRLAGQGGADGPDLTGAGQRFQPRDLLDALISPSRIVSDQYRDTELWLNDGSLVVGRLVGSDGPWLKVLERGASEAVEVHEDDVELRRGHPLSPMPDSLLDTFTREEILDLCAYILAGGDSEDPAFGEDP